jgi:lactobin A/cerein 7B family class IIb bacteriocin
MNKEIKMKELTKSEIAIVSGGILPVLLGYYMYMGSAISSMYTVAKYAGK